TLERLGGPRQIVEQHLERALSALTPEQTALAALVFNHLVTPSGSKIAHATSDLAGYVAAPEDELRPVLSTLGRQRVLRPVRTRGTEVTHEIYHDVLAGAVLSWRSAYEARRALEAERERSRRRHRRLLVLFVAAVLALAAMAAVTAYALAQRSDAQDAAAL